MQSRQGSVGEMLRDWRQRRRMSQLDLAEDAEVSTKHLSFLENGRAHPSEEMLLILASALEIPLRERNALLMTAGYPPAYPERDLSAPALAPVRRALAFLLRKHEPYSALVIDSCWNVLMSNDAHVRTLGWLTGLPLPRLGADAVYSTPPIANTNLLRVLMAPGGLRPLVANFDEVAATLLDWLWRDARTDPDCATLLEELVAYPGIPRDWKTARLRAPGLLRIVFEKDGERLSLFTMMTAPQAPRDVALQGIRIETFFPADDYTERFLRALAEQPEALPAR